MKWLNTCCKTPISHQAVPQNAGVEYSFLYLYAVFALQVDDALSPPTYKKQPNNEHLDIRHMESMLQCTVNGSFVHQKLLPVCTSGSAFKCITSWCQSNADHLHGFRSFSCLSGRCWCPFMSGQYEKSEEWNKLITVDIETGNDMAGRRLLIVGIFNKHYRHPNFSGTHLNRWNIIQQHRSLLNDHIIKQTPLW